MSPCDFLLLPLLLSFNKKNFFEEFTCGEHVPDVVVLAAANGNVYPGFIYTYQSYN
jgi:hypothetical protein